jgi:hypothetical protein
MRIINKFPYNNLSYERLSHFAQRVFAVERHYFEQGDLDRFNDTRELLHAIWARMESMMFRAIPPTA